MAKTPARTSTRKTAPSLKKAPAKKTASTMSNRAAMATKATKPPATAKESVGATIVEKLQPVVSGPEMRKPELIDAVVRKSGVKKKDAKPVVEAMLSIIGSALQDCRELNLQPMGKIKINREKKRPNGKVLIAKIRQAKDLPKSEVAVPPVAKPPFPDAAE